MKLTKEFFFQFDKNQCYGQHFLIFYSHADFANEIISIIINSTDLKEIADHFRLSNSGY